ncbi:hypothetical protein G3I31_19800, partial [Streptomyces sp. SID9913]|nr:hypothetical protein [Streptomyces sp. SID9913]
DAPDARTPEPAERDASEAVDHGAAEDDTDGRDTDAQAPAAERAAGHDAHARPDAGAPETAEQRPGGDHATDATADSGDTDGVDGTGEERDDAPAVPAQRPAEMTMELLIPAPSRPGDDRPTGP